MKRLLVLLALVLPLFAAIEKPPAPADLNAPPADAEKTESGLITKKLQEGSGTQKVAAGQIARIRFTVWKSDGSVLQHSPTTQMLAVNKMLPGWREAVEMMVTGEKRRAWIPSSLGGGKIKEGDALVIDTELMEITELPKTPEDVAAPPADATITASGLAYKVLRPGTGTIHPTRRSTVSVHYSGWTTDGRMFDSSLLRGVPSEFPLDAVIKGWTEGLQLMVAGQRTRFWIPSKLAYGNDRSKPRGMLVFDVELVDVQR